jgi:hypothetical protein
MRNFHLVASGVDTFPLLHSLTRHPKLWNQNKFRTTFKDTPHAQVDDIWLRFSRETPDTNAVSQDINDMTWYPAIQELPQAKSIIRDLMFRLDAYMLCRCVITRLKPGGVILPHADDKGDYVHQGDIQRYHIVLQGLPGSLYKTGEETVCMKTGEVWWFNALKEHSVVNNSVDDRIHMLVDLRLMS